MRNMMGLLGNVAEVKELRPRLMQGHFIKVFSDLLFSTQDGIEVMLATNIYLFNIVKLNWFFLYRLVIMRLELLPIWLQMVINLG